MAALVAGREQRGQRYGVVVQSDALLPRSVVLVAPTSTSASPASFRPKIVAATPVLPQISPITLEGAQGDEQLSELPTPQRLIVAPAAVPDGPARNVAGGYIRMAAAITRGNRFDPDFDHARELHELLEALQHSSDAGRAVKLDDSNMSR